VQAQVEAVRAELASRPAGLVAHTERVLEEALLLAAWWDVDPARVELAVVGHDLFRATPPAELLRLSREEGVPVSQEDEAAPVMLHGPLAATVLTRRFRVDDPEVITAVRDHTTGAAEMPMIGRIMLIADKVESRKRERTPAMAPIRRVARRDLDLALLCWADWKWVDERERGWASHSAHWEARRAWVEAHHGDLYRKAPLRMVVAPGSGT